MRIRHAFSTRFAQGNGRADVAEYLEMERLDGDYNPIAYSKKNGKPVQAWNVFRQSWHRELETEASDCDWDSDSDAVSIILNLHKPQSFWWHSVVRVRPGWVMRAEIEDLNWVWVIGGCISSEITPDLATQRTDEFTTTYPACRNGLRASAGINQLVRKTAGRLTGVIPVILLTCTLPTCTLPRAKNKPRGKGTEHPPPPPMGITGSVPLSHGWFWCFSRPQWIALRAALINEPQGPSETEPFSGSGRQACAEGRRKRYLVHPRYEGPEQHRCLRSVVS
ncbi:hypothetical protein DFH09DRAFT_1271565 [Mycena vulgaris]|nr:hypothetical protein DFH09DRAFT_1271565 [Mycena vulgaris]